MATANNSRQPRASKSGAVRIVKAADVQDNGTADNVQAPKLPSIADLMGSLAVPALPTPEARPKGHAKGREWQPCADTLAACERVGWGLPDSFHAQYAPRDGESIAFPIPEGISASDKRGKLQKHYVLWFVNGMSGSLPQYLANGDAIPLYMVADFIGQCPDVFASVARFNTLSGALNAIADYACRVVVREGGMIRLSDNPERIKANRIRNIQPPTLNAPSLETINF
jgi:hypothetical protein